MMMSKVQLPFQCLNVRGLKLKSNRVKVDTIADMLNVNNSVGIMLTETWLEDSILDAEIQIQGYDLFRADRIGRKCGGVATYLNSDLNCKLELSFSNGIVEALVIKCKKLDIIFVCVYRPPNTSVQEWSEALKRRNSNRFNVQALYVQLCEYRYS